MAKYALVLSGGAQRSCYETGVLKYLYTELPKKYNFKPKFDILCGTSAGALQASYLASRMDQPDCDIHNLIDVWENIKANDVLNFDISTLFSFKNMIYGGRHGAGIVDTTPLKLTLMREWKAHQISSNIKNNHFETLCVSSTSTKTGKTVVFTETNQPIPNSIFRTDFKPVNITVDHAMASASIPFLFPPIKIDHEWYTDGGIRQNTPIAPAVAFGATHVFSVSLWHERQVKTDKNNDSPSIARMLGKIFNSFFLDNASYDVHNLELINSIIEEGSKICPDFAKRLKTADKPFRHIKSCSLAPSKDIGHITARFLSEPRNSKNRLYNLLLKLFDFDTFEADLASYLLFDGEYSKLLLNLGFEDAKAREKEIVDFFGIK